MARLKLLKGRKTWKEVRLATPLARIGRDEARCHVLLDEKIVSRKHAEIVRKDGEYFLVDRHSKAGTTLNGQRLKPGRPYRLKSSSLIKICNFVLMFLDDSKDDESTPSSIEISDVDVLRGVSSVLEASSSSRLARTNINPEAKLAAITEMTQELKHARSVEDLLAKTLDSLLKVFGAADLALVMMMDSDTSTTQTNVVRHRVAGVEEPKAVINAALLAKVTEQYATALSLDESAMCASLVGRDAKLLGVIQLDAGCSRESFTHEDLDLFTTMAAEAAFAVDSWILHEAAMHERELLLELQVANEVQIGLLPESPPEIDGYDFFDCYSPAKQVGGDYFDYIELNDNRLAIVLGDVSGKGIPAAILMAKVSSEISAFLASGMPSLEVIGRVNARLADRSPECRFVTMVLVVLDLRTHELTLVNAGHMLPLLRHRDGTIVEIGAGCSGLPLGVEPTHQYMESNSSLRTGDTLILYSDGVTDAMNASGKMFGTKQLHCAVAANSSEIGKAIMDEIDNHVGDEPQTDDICLLCVSKHG